MRIDRFQGEDDVIREVTAIMRNASWIVLASGGNQGTFRVPEGRKWKAPDLVAASPNGTLLVCEAKLRPSALFLPNKYDESDCDFMQRICASAELQKGLLSRANEVLRSLGRIPGGAHSVVCGLIAAPAFSTDHLIAASGLVILEALGPGQAIRLLGGGLPDAPSLDLAT